jgi:uncharacterized protein (TIGR02466 family)
MIFENLFETPILIVEKPEWVEKTIKVTDKYIEECKPSTMSEVMEYRKKIYDLDELENKKEWGVSFHSKSIEEEKELIQLKSFIKQTSYNFLDNQGFDLKEYTLFFTEMWVQEFSKSGGGYHDTHFHQDNHVSGFYFLKCSPKTSWPVFQDPRHGALMTKLPEKNKEEKTYASEQINVKAKKGMMIFFPSYLGHQFPIDLGSDDFRFIHFNLQAVRKKALKEFCKKFNMFDIKDLTLEQHKNTKQQDFVQTVMPSKNSL